MGADGRDKAITASQNAANALVQEEHAAAMRENLVYAAKVKKAHAAAKKAEKLARNAARVVLEAMEKAEAKVALVKQKAEIQKSEIADTFNTKKLAIQQTATVAEDEYQAQVDKHAAKMLEVQDQATKSDSASTELVDSVNTYFKAAKNQDALQMKEVQKQTFVAQAAAAKAAKAALDNAKMADLIKSNIAESTERKSKAEVELRKASVRLANKDSDMKEIVTKLKVKLALVKENSVREKKAADGAQTDARKASDKAQATEAEVGKLKVEKTQADGKLQVAKLKAKSETELAAAQAAAAKAQIKIKDA